MSKDYYKSAFSKWLKDHPNDEPPSPVIKAVIKYQKHLLDCHKKRIKHFNTVFWNLILKIKLARCMKTQRCWWN